MKKMNCFKIAGAAFGVLVMCFILFWRFHGITVSVDKRSSAVEYRNIDGKTQERELEVYISGKYSYKLWAADNFSGKIIIEDYEQTEGEVRDLKLDENAALIYREYNHEVLNTCYFGVISVKNGFSDFEILVDDGEGIDTENPEHIIYLKYGKRLKSCNAGSV